jgi:hypothetical protein
MGSVFGCVVGDHGFFVYHTRWCFVVQDHFTASGKMVPLGSKTEREIKDYNLSRFACYLIAMNGDPRKAEIAAAQAYFVVSTRAFEIHQLRKEQEERLWRDTKEKAIML